MTLTDHPQNIVGLVVVIIGLCLVISDNINLVQGELQTLTHHPAVAKVQDSAGGLLTFLVVGDWGRKGTYNQSQVAFQVHSRISRAFNNLNFFYNKLLQ